MYLKLLLSFIILLPNIAFGQDLSLTALTVDDSIPGETKYSVSLQILFIMTVLTLLPALVLMMTSFTRIIIVLGLVRQAIGLPQTPTNQILVGIALFLSLFVMAPVLQEVNERAVEPYLSETISAEEALELAKKPFVDFMLNQTRESDLSLFMDISGQVGEEYNELPLTTIIPAFVTSELKTAFQIGFLLFIPFLVIDLVVASVLMAMGMMMLSPLIISLPFKLMLFILVDGWVLIMGTLVSSFGT